MNKNIPTEFLRSFVTIAELGSFTQAGNKLSRSQSAISSQIKKAEELLGQQVFSRKGHNFELTPSGEILMRYATQILQLNDRALGELESKAIVGKVRLGIPSEFAISLLPKIVGNFSRQNPRITLEVICDLSRNLNRDLAQNKYDLILSILDDPDQIKGSYIKRDKLVWVSASEQHNNHDDPIPLIVAPEGCIYRKRGLSRLERANIPWQIIYTIMELSGIKAAIEEGLGMTVLAESTIPEPLKIISPPANTEELGDIGITLMSADENMSEAASLLAGYIKSNLQ
jgi:DNA-binding transcriptional LysR family regulator